MSIEKYHKKTCNSIPLKIIFCNRKKFEPEDEFRLYQKQTEVVQGKGDINMYHITLKINFDIDFIVDKMAFSSCQ